MDRSNRESKSAFLLKILLLIAGVLSPVGAFPLTKSCVPLAADLFSLSLTCLLLLAILLYRRSHEEEWTAELPEGSPRLAKLLIVHKTITILSPICLIVSLFFSRRWHRGEINWQQTIAAPGYMLLIWSSMVRIFIETRRPGKPGSPNLLSGPMQPIESSHWGDR
jgi:hypothetical protein